MHRASLVVGILFRFAMRDHIVAVNRASLVRKPVARTRKAAEERLTATQLTALFASTTGRMRVVLRIAAMTSGGKVSSGEHSEVRGCKTRVLRVLTEQMKEIVEKQRPGFVARVGDDGGPNR